MQTRVRHCKNSTHEGDELIARPCNTLPCPDTVPGTTPIPETTETTTIAPSTPSGIIY